MMLFKVISGVAHLKAMGFVHGDGMQSITCLPRFADSREATIYCRQYLTSPEQLLHRFRFMIVLTWTIPPVFGLGFLIYIGMFTPLRC